MLEDRRVLITGGTGSFGHAASRRLLADGVGELRILSRDELKQTQMRREIGDERVRFYLGDVRDRASVRDAMRGVDLVFHAAALKQVPACEFFPMQAVMTNIVGSDNVIQEANRQGVERVICLGTDKAAYPINAMGMTKALMEKIAQAAARVDSEDTVVATVRYGNVLASRGSVVPLFMEQIRNGGPLTITEPSMTRFLLPLPDAIELVLFALENGQSGDLLIRKAPACTIGVLAQALQELFQREVPEKIIGMRHGEKLFETLATREELARAEDLGDYYRVVMDDRDLNYSLYFNEGDPEESRLEDFTSHNAERLGVDEVKEVLAGVEPVTEALNAWPQAEAPR